MYTITLRSEPCTASASQSSVIVPISGWLKLFRRDGLCATGNRGSPPTAHADDAIDVLYVKDCARAIALVQTVGRLAHSTYNVGSGRATSNAEVVAPSSAPFPAPSSRSSPAAVPMAQWPT